MSIHELDLILQHDPIINTWPASQLVKSPQNVERDYLVHARTHLSLGDTARYVDTIFKWVGGQNKGTFIGAVLGEYGEGKTSFLVHVWASSNDRRILSIPPFQWTSFDEIMDAIAAWLQHLLKPSHPEMARRAQRVYEEHREQSIEALARQEAQRQNADYDTVLATIRGLADRGQVRQELSAERLLDFMAAETEIAREAGYEGLLLLLDEPEVAARALGTDKVQLFLFDLANELHRRQGNYGVFLSMPANFYSTAVGRFSALTARLEVCGCFPRLSDMYGTDFAGDLWRRYVAEFELGPKAAGIPGPLTLQAIGQVGSAARKDLAYGPRSVISAFRRMVDVWKQSRASYTPLQLIQDILDQEIMVTPNYRSRVSGVLSSPDINDENREAVQLLAAFPNGLQITTLEELGIAEVLRPLARSTGPVYRTAFSMGLRALASTDTPNTPPGRAPLREHIEEIDGEYAVDRRTMQSALKAFADRVIPLVFRERAGQQLTGWQWLEPIERGGLDVYLGTMQGAFEQTARQYPARAVMVMAREIGGSLSGVNMPRLNPDLGLKQYDLWFQFELCWNNEQERPAEAVQVHMVEGKCARILTTLDLLNGLVNQDYLAEIVGAARMTPLWALNLLQRMSKITLDRSVEAEWGAVQKVLMRELSGLFFGQEFAAAISDAVQKRLGERISGSNIDLFDQAMLAVLKARYPDYQTLIRQPHWQRPIDDYINALSNGSIPLSAKWGRDPWRAELEHAGRVLGSTSRMNLTGGAFAGFEGLLEIRSKGRREPLEIQFHVHPLEQQIREMICHDEAPKLKRDGKECWYMLLSDVLPLIQGQGYTLDELNRIVAMGQARGSFKVSDHRGEKVLYCAPLDPDELKAQLRAKLADLVAEIKEFKRLPDYVTSLDAQELAAAIERVEDDADYDRLAGRMNKEFEQNHNRLPGYFDRAQSEFKAIRNRVQQIQSETPDSGAASLKVPAATSEWRAALERYIAPNLQDHGRCMSIDIRDLIKKIDGAANAYTYSAQRRPAENIALVLEAWTTVKDLSGRHDGLLARSRQLRQNVDLFARWRALLAKSDQVRGGVMAIKRDAAHVDEAARLLAEYDQFELTIADHIETRNLGGLEAYPQFDRMLDDLERKRQSYWVNLKGDFDRRKNRINQVLTVLDVPTRVNIVFNPDDMSGCYGQLYESGVQLIREQGIQSVLSDMTDQERELIYSRDILQVVDEDATSQLLTGLEVNRRKMTALLDAVDEQWLKDLGESDDEGGIGELAEQITSAREAVRAVRRCVAESARPVSPEDEGARRLAEMLPEGGRIDLKQLVLQTMAQSDAPSQALDASLHALAELFRHNWVQISVERRQR